VHTGREADALSTSLQAEAFTVGSKVFFSNGAYRPGTTSGNEVLAHELGHVVQQGGGVAARRIQRRGALRPLEPAGPVRVQRLFGKKKSAAQQADIAATKSGNDKVVTMNDLEKQISTLEKAITKLAKHHTSGNTDDQSAANGCGSRGGQGGRVQEAVRYGKERGVRRPQHRACPRQTSARSRGRNGRS
jgi:hypothetical protein